MSSVAQDAKAPAPAGQLHPGVAASSRILYYQPAQRLDLAAQAAAPATGPNQQGAQGQVLDAIPQAGGKRASKELKVTEYGPIGSVPDDNLRPQVYIVFSEAAVPVAKLGAPMIGHESLSFDPPLKGTYRWISTKSLVFMPSEDLLFLKNYRCTVKKGTKSIFGNQTTADFSFEFHSGHLELVGIGKAKSLEGDTGEISPLDQKTMVLTFNVPVDPAVVAKGIKIDAKGRDVRFALSLPQGAQKGSFSDAPTLSIQDALPDDATIGVVLKKGALASAQSIGTEYDQARSFRTLSPFGAYVDNDVRYGFSRYRMDDVNPVYIEFSHPLDSAGIERFVKVSGPKGDFPVPPGAVSASGRRLRINGLAFEDETIYTVFLSKDLSDAFGRKLGKDATQRVSSGRPLSMVNIPNEGARMLEAGYSNSIITEMQNLASFELRTGKFQDPLLYAREWWIWGTFIGDSTMKYGNGAFEPKTRHYETTDLKPFLNTSGKGWVFLNWRSETQGQAEANKKNKKYDYSDTAYLALQVTDIGLTTRYGYNSVICLVTSLSTGKPVAGAKVSLQYFMGATEFSSLSSKDGLAIIELKPGEFASNFGGGGRPNFTVRVDYADDSIVFRPYGHNQYRYDVVSTASPYNVEATRSYSFLYTDRKIYRPGEKVTFKAISRDLTLGDYAPRSGGYTVRLDDDSWRSQKPVWESSGRMSEMGTMSDSFDLPGDLKPGSYRMSFSVDKGGSVSEYVIVSNFRRLQSAATITLPDARYALGDEIAAALKAEYLSGGALANASYSGYWTVEPYAFRPDGAAWTRYRFGQGEEYGERRTLSSFSGSLDSIGSAALSQRTESTGVEGKPALYRVSASVTDKASGLAVEAKKSLIVYPAEFLVGSYASLAGKVDPSLYFKTGSKISLNYVLATPDGEKYKAAGGVGVEASVERLEWRSVQQQGVDAIDTRWEQVRVAVLSKKENSPLGEGAFALTADKDGLYEVTVSALDSAGRKTLSRYSIYCTGSSWMNWYSRNADGIELVPEKNSYAVGETASVLMKSPLPKGKYLVTVEREGVFSSRLVDLDGSTQVIEVPVEERFIPVAYVAVSSYSVRGAPADNAFGKPDLDKPKGYFGLCQLKVSTDPKRIRLEVNSFKTIYRPGEKARFTVLATRDGAPVKGAEICFMAVDRGVVDIVDYHVPDPLAFFYSPEKFPLATAGGDSRAMLIDPVTYKVKDQYGGDAEDPKIQERKDFSPTAVFESGILTDEKGMANVTFTWPDNLTTYRCTAVAITKDRFGIAEKDQLVRNPINVRTALPRKMRLRDTAYAGVIVTNLDAVPRKVSVACESSILTVDGDSSRTVTVPAGKTLEVAFALCAEKAGSGEVIFTTKSDVLSERLREKYSVEEPYLSETVATIGRVELGKEKSAYVREGLILPGDAPGQKGKLDISLSATKVPTLTEAIRYVFRYPFGCGEQRSSRLIPLVLFKDRMKDFGLKSEISDPDAVIAENMGILAGYQRGDGGFSWWGWDDKSNPFVSTRMAHMILIMGERKIPVTPAIDQEALFKYLLAYAESPSSREWGQLRSYALYVLAWKGKIGAEKVEASIAEKEPQDVAAWCFHGLAFQALKKKSRAEFCLQKALSYVDQASRSMDIKDRKDFAGYYFLSDKVIRLSLLSLLMDKVNPDSDINQRIINTIIAMQKAGYWRSTNPTFWVFVALSTSIEAENKKTSFKAEVKLAGKDLVAAFFEGLSGERKGSTFSLTQAPISGIQRDALLPMDFSAKGVGALYYSAALTYGIPIERSSNRDEGFEIVTQVLDEDGKPLAENLLQRGKVYKMSVTVTSPMERNFVAIRVPVPSGADIIENYPERSRSRWSGSERSEDYWPTYYGYVSPLRVFDNEADVYIDNFSGYYSFAVPFRATGSGVYPTPAATAECMYEPELFGRDISRLFKIAVE